MIKNDFQAKSIRAFIGAKDFDKSRAFYQFLGFEELVLSTQMSYFKIKEQLGFYLQNAYVKDWIDNSMIFLEVEELEELHSDLLSKNIKSQFPSVRLSAIQYEEWGKECFLHDPSGILWHLGSFE